MTSALDVIGLGIIAPYLSVIVEPDRFSTIEHCDCIYKLKAGRMIKQGSYAEVVQNQPVN